MKVYGYFRSSAAFRVRIALNLKGITPDDTAFVHLRKGEQRAPAYAAKNPQLLVPAIELDEGPVLAQSLAIMEYLDETWPQPPLLPLGAVGRARVRALAMIAACEIHPLQNLRVLSHLRQSCGLDETQAMAWARHWNEVGLTAFEKSLAGHPDTGRFCHGDAPTLADICLVPQVFSAQRFGLEMAAFPTVMRIHEACMMLAAFDLAQPSKQPDAEP
jgi:maleylpyruvate isomerase